jgi:putative transposase
MSQSRIEMLRQVSCSCVAVAYAKWRDRRVLYQKIGETGTKGAERNGERTFKPEEIVNLLRQIEVAVANGKTTEQASREAGIVEQTYYRWRKEYGGLQVDQAKRFKDLEQENAKLK